MLSMDAIVMLLKTCAKEKSLSRGISIHADVIRMGLLGKYRVVGNSLVNMYAKCGALTKAKEVFDLLPVQDMVSWNALISGYAQFGNGKEALNCFRWMQQGGISPNSITFLSTLKACGSIKAVEMGEAMHAMIVEELHGNNVLIGTALIDMYVKCGAIAKAIDVFDGLQLRDVVSWNALITGYANLGPVDKALDSFEHMLMEGLSPDAVTFSSLLKACSSIRAAKRGQEIHARISTDRLFQKNNIVGTSLVDLYGKCDLLEKAQQVFEELPDQTVMSWNTLIAGFVQHGHYEGALKCFGKMQLGDTSPDAVTYACILKACGSIGAIDKGEEIHAQIDRGRLLEKDKVVGDALVEIYVKCGLLMKAEEVFRKLTFRNIVSWNVLITAYAQQGHMDKALNCYDQMQIACIQPNVITFLAVLKACGNIKAAEKGQEIHSQIHEQQLLSKDNVIGCALIDMYVKCGLHNEAREMFDKLPIWKLASSTSHDEETLNDVKQIELNSLFLELDTYVYILKACASIGAVQKGNELHIKIVKEALLESHMVISTALVHMYVNFGMLGEAQDVFDKMQVWDIVSWNALITGYVECGLGKAALKCFEEMQVGNLYPDATTFACALKACGNTNSLEKGHEIHVMICRDGSLGRDTVVSTALIDMYVKCGAFEKARESFDEVEIKNVASWNALITGYSQHGQAQEALECFERMRTVGISPDEVTFLCTLKACGSMAAAMKGYKVHIEITTEGLLIKTNSVGIALVDMYAKCGMLEEAHDVFNELLEQDVVSWNALIAGYGQLGNYELVLELFKKMIKEGKEPNAVTFNVVLNASSHAGLLEEAQMHIETMNIHHGITPTMEHHNCIVDLLGQSGHLNKALEVIMKMPFLANLTIWNTFLGACQNWGNVKLGMLAFKHAIQLNENYPAAYICMSNIYAASPMQEDAQKVEIRRFKKKRRETPELC